jgi:hypothetical protein
VISVTYKRTISGSGKSTEEVQLEGSDAKYGDDARVMVKSIAEVRELITALQTIVDQVDPPAPKITVQPKGWVPIETRHLQALIEEASNYDSAFLADAAASDARSGATHSTFMDRRKELMDALDEARMALGWTPYPYR